METFFNNLNGFQLILIAVGLVVLFPSIMDLIKRFSFSKGSHTAKSDHADHGLTSLVYKWECLCDACEEAGLDEALAKLDGIFPLLVDGRVKPIPEPEPEPQPDDPATRSSVQNHP